MTMFRLFLAVPLLLVWGCEFNSGIIDSKIFRHFGRTLMSPVEAVSIKDIHLNPSQYEEKFVEVQAKVDTVGEYSTFVVVEQNSSRLLVVQTDIPSFSDKINESDLGKTFKIMGKLVVRKRGLPALEAKAVHL